MTDAFRAESVGDSLSLAGVFCAVTGVEEASLNGDEGVVVIARRSSPSAVAYEYAGIRGKDSECIVKAGAEVERAAYLFNHPPVWL